MSRAVLVRLCSVCLFLGTFFSVQAGAALALSPQRPALSLTGASLGYTRNSPIQLNFSFRPSSLAGRRVDVLVRVVTPDARSFYLKPDMATLVESETPVPMIVNWRLTAQSQIGTLEVGLGPDMPLGVYQWELLVVPTGQDSRFAKNLLLQESTVTRLQEPVDVSAVNWTGCPPQGSYASCEAPYAPWTGPGGYTSNQCGYDVDQLNDQCRALIQQCLDTQFPTQARCDNPAYRDSFCYRQHQYLSSPYNCNRIDNTCAGSDWLACQQVLTSDNGPLQRCGDLDLRAFEDACHANYCPAEPDLDDCLNYKYRVEQYCATGTPSRSYFDSEIPAGWVDPNDPLADLKLGSALIDPYMARKFDGACQGVIAQRQALCEALRTDWRRFLLLPMHIYDYSYYRKPYIGEDPVRNLPAFNNPEHFEICAIQPEFPPPEPLAHLPLFTDRFFDQYDQAVRTARQLALFDGLNQAVEDDPARFGQAALAEVGSALLRAETNLSAAGELFGGSLVLLAVNRALPNIAVADQVGLGSLQLSRLPPAMVLALDERLTYAQPGDTSLSSCDQYVYNKYFSYTRLRDEIIRSTEPLQVLRFAYDSDQYPYSLGLAASEHIGVVRKNGAEVYNRHLWQGQGALSALLPQHPLAGKGIRRHKNLFAEVLQRYRLYAERNPAKLAHAWKLAYEPGDARLWALTDGVTRTLPNGLSLVNGVHTLALQVDENWFYYRNRLNALPMGFRDADFDDYRQLRTRLLDLLVIRARLEKTLGGLTLGLHPQTGEDENTLVLENASSYVGTLELLLQASALMPSEKAMILTELQKPVAAASNLVPGSTVLPTARRAVSLAPGGITIGGGAIPVVQTALQALLGQIDGQIDQVLSETLDTHPECFSSQPGACDWLPEAFVQHVGDLVPDGLMNQDHERCEFYNANFDFGTDFGRMAGYRFIVDPKITQATGKSTADICTILGSNPENADPTNLTAMSDQAYCMDLHRPTDYRLDTQALERFFPAGDFFDATANAVGYYLMFKDGGVVENRNGSGVPPLFLGVSHSDYAEYGSFSTLGVEMGYGIGAGVSGVDQLADDVLAGLGQGGQTPSLTPLQASFLAHSYAKFGMMGVVELDLLRLTAFIASSNGFDAQREQMQPGIQTQVRDDAAERIGGRPVYAELSLLGINLYDYPAGAADRSSAPLVLGDSFQHVQQVASITIPTIVPILVKVDAGYDMGFTLRFVTDAPQWSQLQGKNGTVLDAAFEPDAGVFTRVVAGVGFDAGVLSAVVGVEGHLDLLDFGLPLDVRIDAALAETELTGANGLRETVHLPQLDFRNDFSYDLDFGTGFLALIGEARMDLGLFTVTKTFRKILHDFRAKALWHRDHEIFALDGTYKLGQLVQGKGYVQRSGGL